MYEPLSPECQIYHLTPSSSSLLPKAPLKSFLSPSPMETPSKPILDSPITGSFYTLLAKSLHSTFLEFLRFSSLLIASCMEAYLIFHPQWNPISLLSLFCFLLFLIYFLKHSLSTPSSVYLVDFSCLTPPSFCRVPFSSFLEHTSAIDCFTADSISFMFKILMSSGQSEHTYLPPPLHYIPPRSHLTDSIQEAQMLLFPVMDDLLSKTHLSPSHIDILIVNCSAFAPAPSLCSLLINKYGMREDIKSYNISGMGCSAGTLSIHLAQNLLKLRKTRSYAVVLSTEILSNGWYAGKEKPKLLINCMFRMGSAAILLTNRNDGRLPGKYRLFKTLRTQRAHDDKSYNSAVREEDAEGNVGVHLNLDLLAVAAETLRCNVAAIGASLLPFSEKFRYAGSVLRRRLLFGSKWGNVTYVPNFKASVQHFCLPVSGRRVIREIGTGLGLGDREMEPALMTLHRFGNQSSSSVWYELAYLEAKGRVKKGERVWQLGMGTGPKCNSVIWVCIRPIVGESNKGPWSDTIDRYPMVALDRST